MNYDARDSDNIINRLEYLANQKGYDKIVLKLPESAAEAFKESGYDNEGEITGYYNGFEKCCFMSKFLSEERKRSDEKEEIQEIISAAKAKNKTSLKPLDEGYSVKIPNALNSDEMAKLYKNVFKTYPFPIFDPKYLESTLKDNVVYFGIYFENELVALSSSEINEKYENAEMTDFAINPKHRGKQLAKHLLIKMENEMKSRGIKTLYTIARAKSLPMNCTFSGLGYKFGGTLINNTQISGKIESMNLWYKS